MSVNSSSSSLPSASVSLYSYIYSCYNTTAGIFSTTAFTFTSVLILLPVYILVLYVGHRRWRAGTTASHSDLFTYHMVAIELISVFSSVLICCGLQIAIPEMVMLGLYLQSINSSGQKLIHILTCVERYLAVVHPITYLSLRTAKGIRIRNIILGCVWLFSIVGLAQMSIEDITSITLFFFAVLAFTVTVVLLCSLSVLRILIRPGPGEAVGSRQQTDQSKLRAFYTITAILGVLIFRFAGNMVAACLHSLQALGETGQCCLWLSVNWFSLPSCLVLPLLFLHRTGKLVCRKN